jgi:hypothetical protein
MFYVQWYANAEDEYNIEIVFTTMEGKLPFFIFMDMLVILDVGKCLPIYYIYFRE